MQYVARAFPFAQFYIVSVVNVYERGVQLTNLLYREMRESAEEAVEHASNLLLAEGIEPEKAEIVEGLPSKSIVSYAKRNHIDVICMRVYSRRATVSPHRMGSTVKAVLERSHIPVLTLAEEARRFRIERILFPTCGERRGKSARNFALLLAAKTRASVEALYVKERGGPCGKPMLDDVKWKAGLMGIEISERLEEGEPLEVILRRAGENDIIVMGMGRRLSPWHRMGHVTQGVIVHSPIPVVSVPPYLERKRWSRRFGAMRSGTS